jgi:hypothetical protein
LSPFIPTLLANALSSACLEKFPKVNKLDVVFSTELIDLKGNTSTDEIVTYALTRDNAATIKWENILKSNLRKIADKYWESPVVARSDQQAE